MSEVRNAVATLMGEINKRNSKIQEKINDLQSEAAGVKSNINRLMRDMVNYDLAGDTKGQAKADKEITQLRAKYDDQVARSEAYGEAFNDVSIIRSKLPEIFDIASKQKEATAKEIQDRVNLKNQLQQDLQDIQEKIKIASSEIQTLYNRSEDKELLALLKYVEKRSVAPGQEIAYLKAFSQGAKCEALEQFLVEPQTARALPYQGIPTLVHQPVKRTDGPQEVNNLMQHEYHQTRPIIQGEIIDSGQR